MPLLNNEIIEQIEDSIQGTSIGTILLKGGRLTEPDLNRIIALQNNKQILFGDAALTLGILTEEDVSWALASQYSYPGVSVDTLSLSRDLLVVHEPFSAKAEVFRSIRSGLLFSGVGSIIKSFSIVSPEGKDGRTLVAANLAVVFAQLGSRTVLVDLNFREPMVHEVFKLNNNIGASTLIIRRAHMEQALQQTPITGLDILSSGPKPPNPLELLSWQETKNVITALKSTYDVVIVDTPAFSKTADAILIAALCDGNLLVSRKNVTSQTAFGQLKNKLDATGAKILGAVINSYSP